MEADTERFDDIDWLQISDFFSFYFVAVREEEEASQAWENESVERVNYMLRLP